MEGFARTIDNAVPRKDYAAIAGVFSFGPSSWQSIGQGEQRSLAAHFIKTAVNAAGFLPGAFASGQMMHVLLETLGHLPSTVDGAADNKLRQMIFDYKVNEDGDYSAAARVLAGMRMEDDPNSVYYTTPAEKCDGTCGTRLFRRRILFLFSFLLVDWSAVSFVCIAFPCSSCWQST